MSGSTSRRRGLGLIVVAVLALLIGNTISGRPVGVDVVYRFGARAAQLRAVEATYHEGQRPGMASAEGTLRWTFDDSGAPPEKVHATRLPAGEHTVALSITDVAGARRTLAARIDVGAWTRSRVFIDVP